MSTHRRVCLLLALLLSLNAFIHVDGSDSGMDHVMYNEFTFLNLNLNLNLMRHWIQVIQLTL